MSDDKSQSLPLRDGATAWLEIAGLLVLAALAPTVLAAWGPRIDMHVQSQAARVPDVVQVVLSGAVLLAYCVLCAGRDPSPRQTLGLQSRLGWRVLPAGVFLALCAFAAAAAILLTFQRFFGAPATASRDAALEAFRRIPLGRALTMAVWAGFYEEIVARGFLIDRLRKGLEFSGLGDKRWLPTVMGAWLFALGHAYQGPVGVAQTFAAGLLFSLATRLDSGVLVAIVAHVLVDAGSFLMLRYGE